MNPLNRRQLSREIWQEVFGDDDRFLDLYFGHVYQDNETDLLVDYASAPKAIAHTGRVSYAFRVWEERIEAAYISGAATLSSERGRGLMPALLRSAHTKMYQTGKLLAFLIPAEPWLYDYYQRKFGYAKVCYRTISTPAASGGGLYTLYPTTSAVAYGASRAHLPSVEMCNRRCPTQWGRLHARGGSPITTRGRMLTIRSHTTPNKGGISLPSSSDAPSRRRVRTARYDAGSQNPTAPRSLRQEAPKCRVAVRSLR